MGRTKALLTGMVVVLSLTGPVLADDDDDDPTFEQKIIRSLMGGGAARPDIDYRERSPLVIPPSGTAGAVQLPPPDSGARTREMAAWPKDPDKQKKPKSKGIIGAWESERAGERPLTPGELRRGRVAGAGRVTEPPRRSEAEHGSGRPLLPSEMSGGREEKTIFGMFGAQFGGGNKGPQFEGEPTRQSLTQPPTGYQTPSSAEPYRAPAGTGLLSKVPNFFDRGTEPPTR
ncbi:hypothetical protein GJW-30_1_00815 [Variibacter gotjawalensis]|uniref:Uncharacterized protein n=1 Tax=Variibacter gotjawalensis TaxID=1333996 RepID=A0A0S3PQX5_9BRAD|nr:hypothetical protein [Variibacter gotjawalensis]NIK48592.1 hypothetical protein [Variibacter gotjawalensis]RZS50457.1 hypothetical protein EV661_2922 [Variibacter gotjawalensis]BAT58291.1 hypothetical protein GJW-30_1_00815 [Variibacter gotjawalensis]